MNYYPFHIGDYISHTNHLTDAEDLAYRRMIDLYYLTEKPFTDIDFIVRRVKSTPEIISVLLSDFFVKTENGWTNKRADEEISKYHAKADSARNANKVKLSKKSVITELKTELETEPFQDATKNQEPITNNQEPITNLKPIYVNIKDDSPVDCPHDVIIKMYHNILPELRQIEVWNDTRKSYLKQIWKEILKQHNLKTRQEGIDYFNELFQFVRQSPFLMGKVDRKEGKPFQADLEWIIKPTNFVKIIERKYHK